MLACSHSERWRLRNDFSAALSFVHRAHNADLRWIQSRRHMVEEFDDFYDEYTYVVLASGFRARTAARFVAPLTQCARNGGTLDDMTRIFANRRKCAALLAVWARRDTWTHTLRSALLAGGVDGLTQLPMIGPTLKFHLARNLGMSQQFAKPDLHLVRYAQTFGKRVLAQDVVEAITTQLNSRGGTMNVGVGTVDFIFWIWLSHGAQSKRAADAQEEDCCHGGHRLR